MCIRNKGNWHFYYENSNNNKYTELISFYTGSPYVRAISPIKAVAGESFTMHCPFSGYPIESISWEKSGLEIISSKLINMCVFEVHKIDWSSFC